MSVNVIFAGESCAKKEFRTYTRVIKVIPRIGDERQPIPEEKAPTDLWLVMDET